MWLSLLSLTLAQTPTAPALDEDDTRRTEDQVEREGLFEEPDLEIVVIDDQAVKRAAEEMGQELEDLGYEKARRRGDRTVYTHDTGWRHKVVVHDDGWVYFRQRPPHVRKPDMDTAWSDLPVVPWLICAPMPTACVSLGTVAVRRQLKHQDKERTMQATGDELRVFADAVANEALATRLYEEVPALLDSIWLHGVHPEAPETVLETREQRRRAVLDFWLSRTDNPYGDAVRIVVETYMIYEIQFSDAPFTPEELEWANAARTCQRSLEIPSPSELLAP
jgi:hypothetical protein